MAEAVKSNISAPKKSQHPLAVRIFHSLNVLCVLAMASSGLQIYNAAPVFGGDSAGQFPELLLLGGWLAGGRHWHFAVMWVFAINLIWYSLYVISAKRWKTRFVGQADLQALIGQSGEKRKTYALHRIVYSTVLPFLALAVLSGISMYKPVQFDFLSNIAGSWQNLRIIHFITVPVLAVFIIVHSVLGLKVGGWRLTRSIFWGK